MSDSQLFDVSTLLSPQRVCLGLEGHSRKRVLQSAARAIADSDAVTGEAGNREASANAIFDGLMSRERLGSTGLGDGVAIPHCRMACDEIRAMLITLGQGVDFEAPDGANVDLVFVLVVPETESHAHLDALATLASFFSNAANRDAMRACSEPNAAIAMLKDHAAPTAAM